MALSPAVVPDAGSQGSWERPSSKRWASDQPGVLRIPVPSVLCVSKGSSYPRKAEADERFRTQVPAVTWGWGTADRWVRPSASARPSPRPLKQHKRTLSRHPPPPLPLPPRPFPLLPAPWPLPQLTALPPTGGFFLREKSRKPPLAFPLPTVSPGPDSHNLARFGVPCLCALRPPAAPAPLHAWGCGPAREGGSFSGLVTDLSSLKTRGGEGFMLKTNYPRANARLSALALRAHAHAQPDTGSRQRTSAG